MITERANLQGSVIAETLIVAAALVPVLWLVRSRGYLVAGLWREARWWERLLLGFAVLPIPGPVDELAGIVVARRVAARVSRRGSPAR